MKNFKKVLANKFALIAICLFSIMLMSAGFVIHFGFVGKVGGTGSSRPTTVNQTFNGWTNFNNTLYENAPIAIGNEITIAQPLNKYTIKGTFPIVIDTFNHNDTLILNPSNFTSGQVVKILCINGSGNVIANDTTVITTVLGRGRLNVSNIYYFHDLTTTFKAMTLFYTGNDSMDFFILK